MVKVEAYEVPEGLYFSKDFGWVKIEGDKVRMGITDYAQKSLREIVYAELPSVGTEVKQGEPYGTLGIRESSFRPCCRRKWNHPGSQRRSPI